MMTLNMEHRQALPLHVLALCWIKATTMVAKQQIRMLWFYYSQPKTKAN